MYVHTHFYPLPGGDDCTFLLEAENVTDGRRRFSKVQSTSQKRFRLTSLEVAVKDVFWLAG